MAMECDHVDISALSQALDISIHIVSMEGDGQQLAHHIIPENGDPSLHLLYHTSHYDILYPRAQLWPTKLCSNQEYWLRLNKFQLGLKTLTKLDFYKILQFTGIHHLGMSICCTMCTKHLETLKCFLLFFFTLFINCVIWSFLINLSNKSFCLLLLFFLPWMDTRLWFLLCWNPG